MKVLFVGGTGNLSTACTRAALAKNMEVFHLNRGTNPDKAPKSVTVFNADMRAPAEAKKALRGLTFDSVVDFQAFTPEHVRAALDVFAPSRQYVFISSASVYKKPSLTPVITEATPLENPYWDYSQQKIAAEKLLTGDTCDFPYTIVRPSLTYDDGWILSQFGCDNYGAAWRLQHCLETVVAGDGQSLWTITHADDFAKGLVGLLGNPAALGEAFHITSDEFLTWDAIITMAAAALGVTPTIVHIPSEYINRVSPERGVTLLGDKAHSCIFDNAKIKRFVPGFVCEIHYAEGVRRSIDWFNAHPEHKKPHDAMNAELDALLGCWKKSLAAIGAHSG
jgi:nucleoside-diphosphate-sugar epimerase